jgi:hypothetical protein
VLLRHKQIFLVLALIVGLSRFAAVADSLFDWDEALFAAGVRSYDVPRHAPHPPGYPLFIGAAKIAHVFGVDDFRSLQVVVVAGALLLFPALAWFALELGLPFATAMGGAAIFAFLPNVWVYGGTGFSDIPGNTLAIAACALLLRGRRHSSAYIAGAAVLGAAGGFRVATLLIGFLPALLGTWHRLKAKAYGAIVSAMLAGAVIVGGSYAGAALASDSVTHYREAVRVQSEWVRNVDSYRNPGRPPLNEVAWTFFVRPFDQRQQLTTLLVLAGLSLVAALFTRRMTPWLAAAVFVPIAVFTWLNLDVSTPARYATAYLPLYALLAADALAVLSRRRDVQAVLTGALVVALASWTWPAVRTQATLDSPPAAALRWVQQNVPPGTTVFVHDAFRPHAAYFLPQHRVRIFHEPEDIPLSESEPWIVDWRVSPEAQNFVWPRGRLWRIIRQRNFEASVSRVATVVRFGPGWYGAESTGTETFRWMGREAEVSLPVLTGDGRLSLKLYVPVDSLATPPTFEIHFNGALLDRVTTTEGIFQRTWDVPSRREGLNQLRLVTSATVSPSDRAPESNDTRELGLQLQSLTWNRAE